VNRSHRLADLLPQGKRRLLELLFGFWLMLWLWLWLWLWLDSNRFPWSLLGFEPPALGGRRFRVEVGRG
jgi:hypothetical protein